MGQEPNGSDGRNITVISTTPPAPAIDPYYQTYDVMTGVRIAATLGSFFGLMALLMLYKSKSKTEKAMEDPDFTAAAIAEVMKFEQEEERQLQKALEETVSQQLNPRRVRRSLDTSSISPKFNRNTPRFSSFAGYTGLMDPPTRPQYKLPIFTGDDTEEIGSLYDIYYENHLDVPRRPSNITCSSSGSSYLERRDSATTLGLPAIPAHKCKSPQCQFSNVPELYDFYYPIDIRVTEPTPGGSPCGSNRALYDRVTDIPNLKQKLAPLASISSCNSSLGTDIPDFEVQSFASDSVFQDDDDEDTEREIDEFSTDSDVNSDDGACYGGRRVRLTVPVDIEHIPSSKTSSTLVGSHDRNISSSSSEHSLGVNLDEKKSWVQETLF